MKKNHKTAFIADHGQHNWDLKNEYMNHGNRSKKATNANRLYSHYSKGLIGDTYTVYQITEFGKVCYIGMTGGTPSQRWSDHKSRARTLNGPQWVNLAMNKISTDHKHFPEYRFSILHQSTDFDTAEALEIAETAAHGTTIHGYNKHMGGGKKSKKFKK